MLLRISTSTFCLRRSLHTQQNHHPLPWPQSLKHIPTHSLFHKLAGLFLFKQFVGDFSPSEFLLGVKDAVYAIAGTIADKSRHNELEQLLTRRLYATVKPSIDQLPLDASIHLDIESLRHLQLCTVHGTIGETIPGDAFAVRLLGQEIIASEASLEMYSNTFFRGSKEERIEASNAVLAMKGNFELGVSFTTREKYIVFGGDGAVIDGSNKYKTCQHFWKFSSPVNFEEWAYPIDWTVSDINDCLDSSAE